MNLDEVLSGRLAELDRQHLRRQLRPRGPEAAAAAVAPARPPAPVALASNDYLGLAGHPALRAAVADATATWGVGSGASRLITGSLELHHDLERDLAVFKQAPAALTFATGYQAALGTVPALVGPGDVVVVDRLAHACLIDAARLSRAKLRVFRHNDPEDLRRILGATRAAGGGGQVLVITESVFSMDGDRAPLRELVAVKEEWDAWLMVDEAHATGVLGPAGRGWIQELGLAGRVEVAMGTLGKALGASGGFIAGSTLLIDYLVNRARSFIFSTAPGPAAAAAARAGLQVAASAEGDTLRTALWHRLAQLQAGLLALGWPVPTIDSAIVPLIVGPEEAALRLAARLRELGFVVPAIRYPTVARGRARLRLTLTATTPAPVVEGFLAALREAQASTGIHPL